MPRNAHPNRPAAPLRLERLEDREVPAVIYAVTNSQRLITFDSLTPRTLLASVRLSGLTDLGERMTDIDVRPADNGLYGRSDRGRIYLINPDTGVATRLDGSVAIGANIGMDFNPVTDLLRVSNFSGGNVTIEPRDGTLSSVYAQSSYIDGDVFAGRLPRLASLAYTNSVPLPPSTQLFGIDPVTNALLLEAGPPELSQFSTVGSLGIDVGNVVGFDIEGMSGRAFATVQPAGQLISYFSTVNLSTGAVSVLSPIGPTAPYVLDIAVSRTLTSQSLFLPPAIDPRTAGFNTTDLSGAINPPTGPAQGILPTNNTGIVQGLDPGVVSGIDSGLVSGLDPSLVSGLDPSLVTSPSPGLNTGVLTGVSTSLLPTGISPSLLPSFAPPVTGFDPSALGTGFTTGINTGMTGFNTGLNSFGTGFGTVPTATSFPTLIQPLGPGLIASATDPFAGVSTNPFQSFFSV